MFSCLPSDEAESDITDGIYLGKTHLVSQLVSFVISIINR